MSEPAAGGDLPLRGLQVVDLTRLLPGPLATRHLLELGAHVVKIEGPADQGQDDSARAFWQTPQERASGEPGAMFRTLNDGKEMRRLDLRTPDGREALLALVGGADVLVEGFRPGVMARLGLGWPVLQAANPRLVMCAITGYGQGSAWAHRAGHDINYLAMAGVLEQIATEQGELVVPNFQVGDLLGGTQAAVSGILAAVLGVQRTGKGRFVDISMTHEVARHHVLAGVVLAQTGRTPAPGRDLLSGGTPCYGAYRTADRRHLAVGALEAVFWQRFCEAVGHPQWAGRHWTSGLAVGSEESMALRREVADVLVRHPLAHWSRLFEAVDCCVTPVLRQDEARAHVLFSKKS